MAAPSDGGEHRRVLKTEEERRETRRRRAEASWYEWTLKEFLQYLYGLGVLAVLVFIPLQMGDVLLPPGRPPVVDPSLVLVVAVGYEIVTIYAAVRAYLFLWASGGWIERTVAVHGEDHGTPTFLPVAGGAFLVLAGVVGAASWILGSAFAAFLDVLVPGVGPTAAVCGPVGIAFSLVAVGGGVLSIRRQRWTFAVAAGVPGVLAVGFYLLSAILSLVALILIVIAREEFAAPADRESH